MHYWNRVTRALRSSHHFSLSLLQFATQLRLKSLNGTRVEQYTGMLSYNTVNFPELQNGTNIYGKYRLMGDYTPTYAYGFENQVPHKIQHVHPDAKIIFSLRDPTDRTLSHVNYIFKFVVGERFAVSYHNNATAMSLYIHELFLQSIKDYENCKMTYCENYCATTFPDKMDMFAETVELAVYKSLIISLYHVSIAKYMELFPMENLLILDLGEFSKDKVGYLHNTIFPFLGLEPYNEFARQQLDQRILRKSNTNDSPLVEFLPETERALQEFFIKPQLKLTKLLNGRQFSWSSRYGIQM